MYIYREREIDRFVYGVWNAMACRRPRVTKKTEPGLGARPWPVHLLRVSLLRVLESNFPGDSLYNCTDMRIPTP